MTARIDEALWWSGRYVGVGSVRELDPESHSTLRIAPAAFVAEGGSAWQLVLEGEWEVMADQGWERAELQHLVDLGDELLAISGYSLMRGDPPSLWSSTDGLSWSAVASASWAEIWEVGGRGLLAVDGDSSGIVAVGFEGGGCCLTPAGVPVVVFSPDGRTWQRISPPSMTDRALLLDVAATDAGFVIVGAARGREYSEPTYDAEVGVPAAWVSSDGLTWEAAQVDGAEVVGGRLMQVAVAADGLYATGIAQPNRFPWQGPTHGWWSLDGRAWTLSGALGTDLPPGRVIVSDGIRMVSFGRASPTASELAAWVSTNGSMWDPLMFSGTTQYLPLGAPEEDVAGGMPAISAAWMVPDGVLIPLTAAMPGMDQSFWFGTAIER